MSPISDTLVTAFESYQAGDFHRSELLCRQILSEQPDSTEALHILGTIAHQLGRLDEAIACYRRLITLIPDYAEIYYSLAAALHASGELTQAIPYYQRAIALKPNHSSTHYDLGNAFKEHGNLSAAIEQYKKALKLNPSDPDVHCNLANALLEQGQSEPAIAHYQQSLTLSPNNPGVYYNLGNALIQHQQLDAAIQSFRWAVSLAPNYGDAYLKLAESLHLLGQLKEAIFYYQQAIFFQINTPEAHCNLGNAFLEQAQFQDALSHYQKSLTLDPKFFKAYVGIGCTLLPQNQFEKATNYLQQALRLNATHPEANHNLGLALANQNQVNEAIPYFQKAFQFKPDLIEAQWQSKLVLPILYENQRQISIWRQHFCQGLNYLQQQIASYTAVQRTQAVKALAKHAFSFYLGYQGLNDRGVQRKYGTLVHQMMATHYPQWATPLSLPPLSLTDKIRVGYVSAYFRGHTVGKLTLGWIKNSDKQSFEIYTYHIGHKTDFITQEFKKYSDKSYHIYGNLDTVCQQILADQLHILVFTDISMDGLTSLIAGLRLAPVQCVTWGHPVTSGLPTIDYFLSSELMEPDNAKYHYSEQLISLPNIGICYEKPSIQNSTKTRSDFQLREDSVIYLSCQSLFKYLPQFDFIFAQIAQRVPHAQFVFIASPSSRITAQFKARLQQVFTQIGLNHQDYCIILPKQDWVSYINLNLVSHIFLDTLSWSGGNTTLEAIACGLPVVTCPGEFMRGRHASGILKMMGITETIANDEAEYIEISVGLGLDSDWRQNMVKKIYQNHHRLYDDRTGLRSLESFYKKVISTRLGRV
ncbi:tetratricopeptide repeat protein [Coleofasciculus sp.]|uniref:tetratricopeptide repeat protein n=1 Tax=Coleofasciculus sp. TaxID=3100458 RepID=UPI0039F9C649